MLGLLLVEKLKVVSVEFAKVDVDLIILYSAARPLRMLDFVFKCSSLADRVAPVVLGDEFLNGAWFGDRWCLIKCELDPILIVVSPAIINAIVVHVV